MTRIATDARGRPVQALRLGPTIVTEFSDTSVDVAVANNSNDTRIFQLVATAPCHIKIGPGTPVVTINDAYLPAEVLLFIEMGPKDNIAYIKNIAADLDGTAYLTEGL